MLFSCVVPVIYLLMLIQVNNIVAKVKIKSF